MRRKDKEMTDVQEILQILADCKYCRLGMSDASGQPYVVPLNYACKYEGDILTFYFHSAKAGKKLDVLAENPKVCIEVDSDTSLIVEKEPCDYGYRFRSVIALGEVGFVEDEAEKAEILNRIMKHQTGDDKEYDFNENQLKGVCVYKAVITSFTGKQKQ